MSCKKTSIEGETFDGEYKFQVLINDNTLMNNIHYKTNFIINMLHMKNKRNYCYDGYLRSVFNDTGKNFNSDELLKSIKNGLQSEKCSFVINNDLTYVKIDFVVECDIIKYNLCLYLFCEIRLNNSQIEKCNEYEKKHDYAKLKNDYDELNDKLNEENRKNIETIIKYEQNNLEKIKKIELENKVLKEENDKLRKSLDSFSIKIVQSFSPLTENLTINGNHKNEMKLLSELNKFIQLKQLKIIMNEFNEEYLINCESGNKSFVDLMSYKNDTLEIINLELNLEMMNTYNYMKKSSLIIYFY
jgi:hypothetical protein